MREMKYNETHAIVLMKCYLGHVEWEEATSVFTAPQYNVGILEYFILKFVVKGFHLVNSRNL
jgi:hypothetical protein